MLVLTRTHDQAVKVTVGDVEFHVVLVEAKGRGRARLGFIAPDHVQFARVDRVPALPPRPRALAGRRSA